MHNYLNLKHAKLKDLKDLNIIIGPNNCGKTSLLRAVNLLSRTEFGRFSPAFSCRICKQTFNKYDTDSCICSIDARQKYLAKNRVGATFGYDKGELEKVLPKLSERQKDILNNFDEAEIIDHLDREFRQERLVVKEQTELRLVAEHISPIIWDEVKTKIFNRILFCPEARLQNYKGEDFTKFIGSKDFETEEQTRFIDFIKETVDPSIVTMRHSLNLVKLFGKDRFITPIAEQGSGVKSLVCLVADILSEEQTKILLIDEPELGLNPSSKHAFLKFLLEQSKDKQIFLATHDPTFVNPILWNRENVSVYLFSIIKDDFVKVNLVESKQDPNTFAGFLPHTTSLKQVHIYVEGTTDVYIFQIFLDKYVKKRFRDWYRILNKIGIFHLGGDFWSHLLYTIPKSPYTSVIILDGHKRPPVRKVIKNYSRIDRDRFRLVDFAADIPDLMKTKPNIPCPIYCLKFPQIEDYLDPKPSSKDEGPKVAFKMGYVHQEIVDLFDAIFQMAGIRMNEKARHS